MIQETIHGFFLNGAIWSVFDTILPSFFVTMLNFYKRNNHIKATRLLEGSRACFSRNFVFNDEFDEF